MKTDTVASLRLLESEILQCRGVLPRSCPVAWPALFDAYHGFRFKGINRRTWLGSGAAEIRAILCVHVYVNVSVGPCVCARV